jgi:c(7)-type cytochrome triheme protein
MTKLTVCTGVIIILFLGSAAWCKVGGGDITFKVNGSSDVLFSHDVHVGQKALKCAECHQLYAIAKISKGTTMEDMRKGKYCGACHNSQRAFGINENCERCHKK